MKKILIFAMLALVSFTSQAQLLYKISGNGLKEPSYIVGTYHLAKVSFVDSIPGIRRVMNECQQTYCELRMQDMFIPDSLAIIQKAQLLPEGTTLDKVLSAEEMTRLNAYMKDLLGADMTNPLVAEQMGKMTPGAIGLQLSLAYFIKKEKDFDINNQFDTYFQKQEVDANGEPVWQWDDEADDFAVDADGNKIPVMYDVQYNSKGEEIADPNTYKGTDILRPKVTGREKTKSYSDADYYVTKQSTLPKVYGGFGTTIKAYGFDFSINCSYSLGGKQYDGTYANFMANPQANSTGTNIHRDILNAWSPTNKNSDIPRWQYQDLYVSSMSTRFLTNASYLNIENINFGYTIPKSLTRKFQVEDIRLYFAAENVYYWSKRKGFDPRQSYSTTTNATYYSPMRTLSGGITLTF